MLIHVFDDTPHHYIGMKAFFLEQCQVQHPQYFWVRIPKKKTSKIDKEQYFYYENNLALIDALKRLPDTAQVVFHGIFEPQICRRLILLSVTKRCSCIFWGADIYRYLQPNRTLKSYLSQFLHAVTVNRMRYVVNLNRGDGELVAKFLHRKNSLILPYPLIGYAEQAMPLKEKSNTLKVLVGNSAAKSNNHRWALEQFVHLTDENIEIIMPLNYAGTDDYIAEIIAKGKSMFGDKFHPVTEMLDKEGYNQLLADIDITLFAQNRQQGLYVVYAMLQMGKPIFLKEATSSYRDLTSLGFDLGRTESFSALNFDQLNAMANIIQQKNQSLMKNSFSEQALAPKWSAFLNSLVL